MACGKAQRVGGAGKARPGVVGVFVARAAGTDAVQRLAKFVVAEAGLLAVGPGDAQQRPGGDIQLVAGLAPQCVDTGGQACAAVKAAVRAAAVLALKAHHALQATLALQVVDALTSQTVGDSGAVLRIVEAVRLRTFALLPDDLACVVVGVVGGGACRSDVTAHAPHQHRVVLKLALQAAVAGIYQRD